MYVVHEKIITTARLLEGRGRHGGCLHISVRDKSAQGELEGKDISGNNSDGMIKRE